MIKETIQKMQALAAIPMTDDRETKRVEIVMLKFKESPEIIDKAVTRIIHNTDWPFKLTVFDNRLNSANTSRIWNKLVNEATCDYILIIDSDAYIPEKKTDPCWLTRMMESIDETGIVIPISNAPGGHDQNRGRAEAYPSAVINKGIWSGYCFLFTIKAWQSIGEFNEKFYIYGQDSEFAHRAKEIGGAVMRKDVLVEHIGGASFNANPDRADDKLYARELFLYLTKK